MAGLYMNGYDIRFPRKYKDKAILTTGWKFTIRDSNDEFVGMGEDALLTDRKLSGGARSETNYVILRPGDEIPKFNNEVERYLLLRPDEFKKESWLERQLKGRRHILVPLGYVEFEQAIGPVPSKLKFSKEELHKYTEVRI